MKRRRAAALAEQLELAYVVAWTPNLDGLEDARRQSRDALVESMGDRLRGPVEWYQVAGDQAQARLADLGIDATPELRAYYGGISTLLRNHGGWMVLAVAAVTTPTDPGQ